VKSISPPRPVLSRGKLSRAPNPLHPSAALRKSILQRRYGNPLRATICRPIPLQCDEDSDSKNPDDDPQTTSLLPTDPYWQSYTDALYNTQPLLHDVYVAEDNYSQPIMASYAIANSKSHACTSKPHGEDPWLAGVDVGFWKAQVERLWALMGYLVECLREPEMRFDFGCTGGRGRMRRRSWLTGWWGKS
jgi:hypothetical protein